MVGSSAVSMFSPHPKKISNYVLTNVSKKIFFNIYVFNEPCTFSNLSLYFFTVLKKILRNRYHLLFLSYNSTISSCVKDFSIKLKNTDLIKIVGEDKKNL